MCQSGKVGYKGVNADYKKAHNFYLKAAIGSNAKAQSTLGFFYFKGLLGFHYNLDRSKFWYCKAALQGNEEALVNLGINASSECPKLIAEGQESGVEIYDVLEKPRQFTLTTLDGECKVPPERIWKIEGLAPYKSEKGVGTADLLIHGEIFIGKDRGYTINGNFDIIINQVQTSPIWVLGDSTVAVGDSRGKVVMTEIQE